MDGGTSFVGKLFQNKECVYIGEDVEVCDVEQWSE